MNIGLGNRRLLKLAAFLKTVPRKRFDYETWVGDDWKGSPDLSCGTRACALGWATAMPAFRRLGLRLGPGRFSTRVHFPGAESSIEAAQAIFGLEHHEALFLFVSGELLDGAESPGSRATPKQVAKHIERFVKTRSKPPSPVDVGRVA